MLFRRVNLESWQKWEVKHVYFHYFIHFMDEFNLLSFYSKYYRIANLTIFKFIPFNAGISAINKYPFDFIFLPLIIKCLSPLYHIFSINAASNYKSVLFYNILSFYTIITNCLLTLMTMVNLLGILVFTSGAFLIIWIEKWAHLNLNIVVFIWTFYHCRCFFKNLLERTFILDCKSFEIKSIHLFLGTYILIWIYITVNP